VRVRPDIGFERPAADLALSDGHDDGLLVIDPNPYVVTHGTPLRAAIFDGRNSPLNGRSWSKSLNNARCTAQFAVFFCTLGDWIQMS
jgi:hypothetical protein